VAAVGGTGRAPNCRVSSAFIRTGSTWNKQPLDGAASVFEGGGGGRACWERGVSKSVVLLTGDRGFESISLHQRVGRTPNFPRASCRRPISRAIRNTPKPGSGPPTPENPRNPVGAHHAPRIHRALQVERGRHRVLGQSLDGAPRANRHLRIRFRPPALPGDAGRQAAGRRRWAAIQINRRRADPVGRKS